MTLKQLLFQEQVIKNIREFFYKQSFHEIIIPTLNPAIPIEPNIHSFSTTWNTIKGCKEFFLPTSPEREIKIRLGQGIGNCFAIGQSFRNLENSGPWHTPEFLMLEWYRENATYKTIIDDVKQLFNSLTPQLFNKSCKKNDWPVLSLENLFEKYLKLNYKKTIEDDNYFFQEAKNKGYNIQNSTWNELFDQILVNEIEPKLPKDPVFMIDFPSRLSPLCQVNKKRPYLSNRFEFYINGVEIANGNTENTDSKKIEILFKQEKVKREKLGLITPPIDKEFIKALDQMSQSGKIFAGIGLGLERLIKILSSTKQCHYEDPAFRERRGTRQSRYQ